MASFNCFGASCVVKTDVKTEVITIEPQPPSTPKQTRSTHARIYRPWEDSPSRPCSPPASPPSSCSSPQHSSSSLNLSPHLGASSRGSAVSPRSSSASPSCSSVSSSSSSTSPCCGSASPRSSSASSESSSSASPHSSDDVLCQHAAFLQAVSRLQARVPPTDTWLATLVSCYLSEVFRLESYRSHALLTTQPATPAVRAALHQSYDSERLALLHQANSSLLGYSYTLSSRVTAVQQHNAYQPLTPPTTPQGSYLDRSYSSGSGASSPDSTPSPRLPHSRTTIDDTPSRTPSPSAPNKRLLGRDAVRVLETWYRQHQQYPYADATQVRQLAAEGELTFVQVRKWLANRRLRGHNTKGKSLKGVRSGSSYC